MRNLRTRWRGKSTSFPDRRKQLGGQAYDSAMEQAHGLTDRNKAACSIEHVEELVIHWMTTGRVDYPFARTSYGAAGWRHSSLSGRVDLNGARPIGELAVHRESLERVMMENPQPLQVILDALLDALRQEIAVEAEPVALQEEEKELCGADTLVRRFGS